MYQKVGVAAGAGVTGGLAHTGIGVVWMILAGFALLAAGSAILRIMPKFQRTPAA